MHSALSTICIAHSFGLELVVMEHRLPLRCHPRARPDGIDVSSSLNLLPQGKGSDSRSAAPGRVRLAASMLYRGRDRARLARAAALAREARRAADRGQRRASIHHPDRRPLADVLTCIREKVTIDRAGRKLAANAERYLKPPQEMARLFRDAPEAIEETLRSRERSPSRSTNCDTNIPTKRSRASPTPQDALAHLTYEGAQQRYPDGIPDKVRQTIEHELALIAQLQYAPYFLTVYDIVRYARSQNILCQGRGSAANSDGLLLPRRHRGRSRHAPTCCSSASSRPSATSRPTSTSISSTSGARR